MRNLSYLSSLFLFLLLLSACGDKDNPQPATDKATFRVDFTQTGDYLKFIRIVSISGGEFRYKDTNELMPAALLDDNLKMASFSVEAANVSELDISTMTGFSSVEEGPATMTMTFTIYKNGVEIDEKSYTYTHTTDGKSEVLNYKAN